MVEWNSNWKASTQPRKQRKYRYNAPMHIKRKFLSAQLSKDLRKKHSMRSIPVITGDTVKVTTGEFKNKIGKVEETNTKTSKVTITGVDAIKVDGSKYFPEIHASNLMITELNLKDKRRIKQKSKETTKETKEKGSKK